MMEDGKVYCKEGKMTGEKLIMLPIMIVIKKNFQKNEGFAIKISKMSKIKSIKNGLNQQMVIQP